MRSLRDDDRGSTVANFFLALVIAAVMTWIMQMVHGLIGPQMEAAVAADDEVGQTAVAWSAEVFANAPAVFVFTAVVSLLALSVYQRALQR